MPVKTSRVVECSGSEMKRSMNKRCSVEKSSLGSDIILEARSDGERAAFVIAVVPCVPMAPSVEGMIDCAMRSAKRFTEPCIPITARVALADLLLLHVESRESETEAD